MSIRKCTHADAVQAPCSAPFVDAADTSSGTACCFMISGASPLTFECGDKVGLLPPQPMLDSKPGNPDPLLDALGFGTSDLGRRTSVTGL